LPFLELVIIHNCLKRPKKAIKGAKMVGKKRNIYIVILILFEHLLIIYHTNNQVYCYVGSSIV
jgi:hypothetical protein